MRQSLDGSGLDLATLVIGHSQSDTSQVGRSDTIQARNVNQKNALARCEVRANPKRC